MTVPSRIAHRAIYRPPTTIVALAALALALTASATTMLATARPGAAAPARITAGALDASAHEEAAGELLERAIGDAASQVTLDLVPADDDGSETFTISGRPGRITVAATSPVALTAGAGWYLKHVVHAGVNLGNPTPSVPDRLPAPATRIVKQAHEANRFVFNDTNEGYTDPYLDWEGWQELLDNYALHGVNQVYVGVGTDAVYHELFQRYGYTDAEMKAWIPQPAHQPWWLLQNMSSSQEPMTQQQLDERADLGARIVKRTKELGMTPVLPGYFGTVPTDFETRNPTAEVVPQGDWVGYQRPGWLDPTNPVFAEVAADFYRISAEMLGAAGGYKMDPLHEGGRPGDVPVAAAATAIQDALRAAHPEALWVILGWQNNPSAALLSGITDKSRLLIVDGLSDRYADFDRETKWPGAPYAFGSIYNFGGHTTMGSNSQVWLNRYFAARAKAGSNLVGVAIMPEGFYNNPVSYELLAELPWLDAKPDLGEWLRTYALGRYGTDAAAGAWDVLGRTAYATPANGWSESQDSLFTAEPSLSANRSAEWSPGFARYDLAAFEAALPELAEAAPSVAQREAYRYDLTDTTRQVIANRSRALLPEIAAAYRAKDLATFDTLTAAWLRLMSRLDTVLAADDDFLLGPRLESARTEGGAVAEHDLLNILTAWGHRAGFDSGLGDYANREWQGLVGDYYASRWKHYFTTLRTALTSGQAPAATDWFSFAEKWANASHRFPTKASGDPVSLARETIADLATDPSSTRVAISASGAVRPTAPATVTTTVTNTSGLPGGIDSATVTLETPEGLDAEATSPTTVSAIGPGESRTVTWRVSVAPGGSPDVLATLKATTTFTSGGDTSTRTTSTRVLVGDAPGDPWRTFASTDSSMATNGDRIALSTRGADMWGTTLQFGTAYRDNAMVDGTSVTLAVDQQDSEGSRPWARSGILVSSDLSRAQSPGTVNLAVTPANGCVLSWSPGTTGSLSQFVQNRTFAAPVWLRLTRTGSTYTGECSADGTTWTTVGTATPGGTVSAPDVGLFSSAANSGGADRLTTVFSGWSIRTP
ncbi:alpha-N-acetylglucosaminidase TIM-barrel domain-containing protein [Nocardioides sp. NPDC000445]|uniref:alpha-N-acetylglucosaminidase n=1 Tax=Nocardioides sp. NPDC000445 TaxID=3154257 RepID=UPI0033293073